MTASTAAHRDKWLSLLESQGIGHPRAFNVVATKTSCVYATEGEPPGTLRLAPFAANVLVAGMAPIQHMRQRRDGRTFESDIFRGDMVLMPQGSPSEWTWTHPCDRLDVAIDPDIFGDGAPFEVVSNFRFRDAEMEPICRGLYAEAARADAAEKLYVESLVMQLAVLLRRRHSPQSATERPKGGLTRSQMRRVVDYIESNLNTDLALGDLAGQADLSLHHFAHMFKQSMGAAPHRYVLERRVDRAKQMLRSGRASLVEISLSLGFCSQSHFTNTFRRMVGATPSEFRIQS